MPDSLQRKVAFLSMPSNYPERPLAVEPIETHMSWVFLTDRFAYKLKKPALNAFLDFRSLASRRHYCEEEVRLNRRLAADVYLDVVPLTGKPDGDWQLAGEGKPVEWLIKMRRLPSQLSLDQCILGNRVPEKPFKRLAESLGRFYLGCPAERVTPQQYREGSLHVLDEVLAELKAEEYGMPPGTIDAVDAAIKAFLLEYGEMLEERARNGKIIDGHGDLRAEHVYLENRPVVVDCLEFSKTLRTVDAAADMAFLALDCERLGAPERGEVLLAGYGAITGDQPPPALIHFYQAMHACIRARLALWHLREPQYAGDPKWRRQAEEWLCLARRHAGLLLVSQCA